MSATKRTFPDDEREIEHLRNLLSQMQSNSVKKSHRLFQWSATTILFLGAFIVSAVPQSAVTWHVFVAFFVGHAIWLIDSIYTRHPPMTALNLSFLLLDIYAIAIRVM